MTVLTIIFQLAGSLALFLYGMQLASDGIQRAAGDRLQRTVNFMTRNTFFAIITGMVITVFLQSSSAATVMVVSFANAGLLGLVQAVGVIMGSNIGTTLTGWIIALAGVSKFSILALAVPVFGVGYFMTLGRNNDTLKSYGESLMGFAMIFLGLDFLAKAIPAPSGDILALLQHVSGLGWLSTLICVAAGTVFTMLIRASSATLAVAIGLASKGIIDFPMAAALTLGANIGTTIDSWILSLRGNTNAKRAAWAHISFNLLGTVWVVILFRPFLRLVDFAVPGAIGTTTIGAHIAMLHTLFNMTNTLLLYPFTRQFAALISRLIKEKSDTSKPARLQYSATPLAGSPELNLIAGRKQIADMAGVTRTMFSCFCEQLPVDQKKTAFDIATFREWSDYADSMHQELGNFLLQVTQQDISDRTRDNISIMLRLINELDNISKSCLSLGYLLQRREKKNLSLKPEELDDLVPYTLVVDKFLEFVQQHINERIDENQLTLAASMEAAIDAMRSSLRKKARKRLKKGADVKTELLFMDMIRYIEKIGDHAYAIAGALSEIH